MDIFPFTTSGQGDLKRLYLSSPPPPISQWILPPLSTHTNTHTHHTSHTHTHTQTHVTHRPLIDGDRDGKKLSVPPVQPDDLNGKRKDERSRSWESRGGREREANSRIKYCDAGRRPAGRQAGPARGYIGCFCGEREREREAPARGGAKTYLASFFARVRPPPLPHPPAPPPEDEEELEAVRPGRRPTPPREGTADGRVARCL